MELTLNIHGRIQRGAGGPDSPLPEKSQVVICFLRNTGTDLSREAIGPMYGPLSKSNLDPIPMCPIASRERSVRPSVKYVDN